MQFWDEFTRLLKTSQTYVDKNYPWTGILVAEEFSIISITNRQKVCSPGQLLFGCDIILSIKHKVDWELIRQQKQAHINTSNIRKNRHRVVHDYKVRDKAMLTKHTAYKYGTPYTGPFVIAQYFTNGTEILQFDTIQIKYNIHCIKPYKSDTKVEDSSSKRLYDYVNK